MHSVTIRLLIPSRRIEYKRRIVSTAARRADQVTMRYGAALNTGI